MGPCPHWFMHPAWLTRTSPLSPAAPTLFLSALCTSSEPCFGHSFPDVHTNTWYLYWPIQITKQQGGRNEEFNVVPSVGAATGRERDSHSSWGVPSLFLPADLVRVVQLENDERDVDSSATPPQQ